MAKNSNSLSTDPYKGVRDFYPEDMFFQNYVFETLRRVSECFGYLEYNASPLEPTELYTGKTSEEIVNEQTYTFKDRGDRLVTLRPEMTPTITRMVAGRRRDIALPARLYSIANMFRYERPQRGRVREHWQLNADIFGVPSLDADTEIIALAAAILAEFGATSDHYEIRINNRRLLNAAIDLAGIDKKDEVQAYMRLLDAKEKMDPAEFSSKYTDALAGRRDPLEIIEKETAGDIADARAEANTVIEKLAKLGVTNTVFSPTLVRGFDYYTGITFEIFDVDPENPRSLFGGGRYDNLFAAFGVPDMPAVGFGMGDVTLRDFLETHNLLPSYVSSTILFVATTGPDYIGEAMRLAKSIRKQDIPTAVNLLDRKIGDQIKAANKMHIPFLLCIGETEVKEKKYTIKRLDTGEEVTVSEDDIADVIWAQDV